MKIANINKALAGFPPFRTKQALEFALIKLGDDWDKASNLPKELKEKLKLEASLAIKGRLMTESKGTMKAVIELEDGLSIETVLIRNGDGRNTVCLSSQVGCPMGCVFCATGAMGFERNLEADEILEQLVYFSRILAGGGEKIDNVVFMGMGEPFLNFENVIKAIRVMNDEKGLNIGARHISISTVGVAGWLRKILKEDIQVNIAISLHAADEESRSRIVGANKAYPMAKILSDVDHYIDRTNRKVMFEYVLIEGVNDRAEDAERLSALMKKPLYMVNVIPCNPVGDYKPSKNIAKFTNILRLRGVNAVARKSQGRGIKAACGQLAGKGKAR